MTKLSNNRDLIMSRKKRMGLKTKEKLEFLRIFDDPYSK